MQNSSVVQDANRRRDCMKLVKSRPFRVSSLKSSRGFSLIELLVAMVVALILAAIAIPSIVTTYSQYRLGVQATLIADQLDLLRMNAIRRNTTIVLNSTTSAPCSTGTNTVLYIDVDKSNACDSRDPQVRLPMDMQIANAGGATPGRRFHQHGHCICDNPSFAIRRLFFHFEWHDHRRHGAVLHRHRLHEQHEIRLPRNHSNPHGRNQGLDGQLRRILARLVLTREESDQM